MNWLWTRQLAGVFNFRFYSMKTFTPVSHVIFDLDGTLLDTETIYTQSYRNVIETFGKKYDDETRLAVTGTMENDTCRIMVERLDLPISPDEFGRRTQGYQEKAFQETELKPGAERLIRHLNASNIPIAIATSSGLEKCKIKLSKHMELFQCFNHLVSGSSDAEVLHGKPAPDIFLIAAERFPVPPDPKKCLVFEDAATGVTGAIAAGMQVVMVPEDYVPIEMTKEATLVLNSLEEFKPEEFGLPPFPN